MYHNVEGKKYAIGVGESAAGIIVWNYLSTTSSGDYETIAVGGADGKISYHDKETPKKLRTYLEAELLSDCCRG